MNPIYKENEIIVIPFNDISANVNTINCQKKVIIKKDINIFGFYVPKINFDTVNICNYDVSKMDKNIPSYVFYNYLDTEFIKNIDVLEFKDFYIICDDETLLKFNFLKVITYKEWNSRFTDRICENKVCYITSSDDKKIWSSTDQKLIETYHYDLDHRLISIPSNIFVDIIPSEKFIKHSRELLKRLMYWLLLKIPVYITIKECDINIHSHIIVWISAVKKIGCQIVPKNKFLSVLQKNLI
jgi:hypothetical protein